MLVWGQTMLLADHLVYPQLRTSLCFRGNLTLWVTYLGPTLTVLEKQSEIGGFDFFN